MNATAEGQWVERSCSAKSRCVIWRRFVNNAHAHSLVFDLESPIREKVLDKERSGFYKG